MSTAIHALNNLLVTSRQIKIPFGPSALEIRRGALLLASPLVSSLSSFASSSFCQSSSSLDFVARTHHLPHLVPYRWSRSLSPSLFLFLPYLRFIQTAPPHLSSVVAVPFYSPFNSLPGLTLLVCFLFISLMSPLVMLSRSFALLSSVFLQPATGFIPLHLLPTSPSQVQPFIHLRSGQKLRHQGSRALLRRATTILRNWILSLFPLKGRAIPLTNRG